jgi:hypothetical protein
MNKNVLKVLCLCRILRQFRLRLQAWLQPEKDRGATRPILVRFCIRIAQNADPVKAILRACVSQSHSLLMDDQPAAMDSRSPSICAQKWLRRGFVTFESSGQKKTVWSILLALKSSTTSTNPLAMIFLPSFAILRGKTCFFFVKTYQNTLKLGVDRIYWNLKF